jgi:hypothetical protein
MMASGTRWQHVAAVAAGAIAVACAASERYAVSPEAADDANDTDWTIASEPRSSTPDAGVPETPPGDAGEGEVDPSTTGAIDGPTEAAPDAGAGEAPATSGVSTAAEEPPSVSAKDSSVPPSAQARAPVTPTPPPKLSAPRVRWNTSAEGEKPLEDEPEERRRRPVRTKSFFLNFGLMHGRVLGDDFQGTTALIGSGAAGVEVALVPNPGADTGFFVSVAAGHLPRGHTGYSVALEYSQTWMSTTFVDVELGNGKLVEFAVPFRLLIPASDRVVPYLESGAGLLAFWVEESTAWLGFEGELLGTPRESKSTGFSFDLAIGITFLFTDNLGIELGLGYRALFFDQVNDRSLDENLAAGRWLVRLGPSFQL